MKGPTNSSARPNIRLLNVSATFESNPDTSTNTEFPYRASIQADGVSEYMSAIVMFSQIQAASGIFATYCQTGEDVVYIYAKTNPTPNEGDTITIPAVSCDLSVNYINVDNVPTEDSPAVITSGGVYDALESKADSTDVVNLTDNQTVAGVKTFTSKLNANNGLSAIYGLELFHSTPFVDFHYNNSSSDFTSRIIDDGSLLRIMRGSGAVNIYDGGSGSGYVQASYRSYNQANLNDVVTIGSLNQNKFTSVAIPSGKTFVNGVNDLVTCTVPQAGVYLCVGRLETASTGTISQGSAYVTGLGQNSINGPWLSSGTGAYDFRDNVCYVFNCNANDVIHLILFWAGSGSAAVSGALNLIRIM